MTIDEAINIAKSDIKYNKSIGCDTSYEEQLAEWLEELKAYKEIKCNKSVYLANKSIDMIDAVNKGYTEGYNKALDDFVEKLIRYVDCGHLCSPTEIRWPDLSVVEMVKELSEQLKERD